MKSFEEKLITRFEIEEVPEPNYDVMWGNIQQSVKRSKRPLQMRVWLAVAMAVLLLLSVSLTVGKPYFVAASESLVQLLFGSKEHVKKLDPAANDVDIMVLEGNLQFAKQIFTEKEWATYTGLLKYSANYIEKITKVEDGVRIQDLSLLTATEKRDFDKMQNELKALQVKLDNASMISMDKAKSLAKIPIAYPSYVPEGYELQLEEAKMNNNSLDNLLIQMKFKDGEYGFLLSQSLEGLEGSFDHMFDYKKTYHLDGIDFTLGIYEDSNVTGLEMLVPKTNISDAYKVSIIADVLGKEDMEKILLSTLKE
jgi:hypothetical protein